MRHVDGRQFKVIDMVAVHQPLQRKGVPYNLSLTLGTDALDSLADILVGQRIGTPSVVYHQVVAQRAVVDDDLQPRLA